MGERRETAGTLRFISRVAKFRLFQQRTCDEVQSRLGLLPTNPPPETCEDALKIVCLVNPLIEALESFHEDLGEKMHSLSAEVEKLRSEVP